MKLSILLLGTRGDIQPYVALALGLQARGHTVKVAAPLNFRPLVEAHALEYSPVHVDFRHLLESTDTNDLLGTGRNVIRFLAQLRTVAEPILQQIYDDLWAAAQGSDALILTAMTYPAYFMAQDLGIPAFGSFLQPLIKTTAFPSPLFSTTHTFGRTVNRWSHQAVYQLFWHLSRASIQRWRARHGVLPVPSKSPFPAILNGDNPVVCGFSEALVQKPADWHHNIYSTGYWFLDPPPTWSPPASLSNFLADGSPPVCLGFGSMNDSTIDQMYQQAVTVLRKHGIRALLLTGWSNLSDTASLRSRNIYVTESVPHSWLFPRVKAVVHHGGAGTSAATLRAGVPSLVVPFFFDQYFWGRQLEKAGAALSPMLKRAFTASRFETKLLELLHDEALAAHAQRIKRSLGSENGVHNAVAILEGHLLSTSTPPRVAA